MNWTRTNAINTAVTLHYILDGFGTAAFQEIASSQGYIDTSLDLAEYAAMSEELLIKLDKQDFPGVYDYEVSTTFGKWLYTMYQRDCVLPTLEQARPHLVLLIAQFFAQGRRTAEVDAEIVQLIKEMA